MEKLTNGVVRRLGCTPNLFHADLRGAILTKANLLQANLKEADLGDADLCGVNLSGADLTNAQITNEQLKETESLKGATMPNGHKYEDWLGTLGAQDWFRKYTKKLEADKKSKGTNETWEKTAEGKE